MATNQATPPTRSWVAVVAVRAACRPHVSRLHPSRTHGHRRHASRSCCRSCYQGLRPHERRRGRTVCRSNIRQIVMVNGYYAEDNNRHYCPGASGFLENLNRWHGRRDRPSQPFDGTRGPLVPYLGPDRGHPPVSYRSLPGMSEPKEPASNGATAGYGYNNAYVGVHVETQAAKRSPDRGGPIRRTGRPHSPPGRNSHVHGQCVRGLDP